MKFENKVIIMVKDDRRESELVHWDIECERDSNGMIVNVDEWENIDVRIRAAVYKEVARIGGVEMMVVYENIQRMLAKDGISNVEKYVYIDETHMDEISEMLIDGRGDWKCAFVRK